MTKLRGPWGPSVPVYWEPPARNSERGTAAARAAEGSGIRAGGDRGQRFAYCYGDRLGSLSRRALNWL